MGQRQFDMENEQDYTELFKLFSPEITRIKKLNDKTIILENDNGIVIDLPSCFNIKWGNLTYIDRPVDKSKWIGCLCFFWYDDEGEKNAICGTLTSIDKNMRLPYELTDGDSRSYWKNCRPVKRSEIRFVEDGE